VAKILKEIMPEDCLKEKTGAEPPKKSEVDTLAEADKKAKTKAKARSKVAKSKPKPADVIPGEPPEDKLLDGEPEKKYTCKKCNHSFDQGNTTVDGGLLCPICYAKQ
jgi:rubrerythrin